MPDVRLARVALVFFLLYALGQTAIWAIAYRGYLDPALELLAQATGLLSNWVGTPATVVGNEIYLATRTLRIDLDCTGVSILLVYSALMLAYPLSARAKCIGLVVGIPALVFANLARLLAVAVLSDVLQDNAFFFVHDYLFKAFMVAVVVMLWAFFLSRTPRDA